MMYSLRLFLCAACAVGCVAVSGQSLDSNIKAARNVAASAAKSDPNAQPDSIRWKTWGTANLSSTQTRFWNWLGGGEPTFTINSNLSLFANYKKNKFFWENNAYLAYGLVKKAKNKAVKNDDQINLGSRTGYQMADNWYYTFNALGKTQFTPGYRYSATDTTRISDFFAPMSIYLSLGLSYKPSANFSLALSPVMGKSTIVHSNSKDVLLTAGLSQELIDAGKKTRNEFGGGIELNMNNSFLGNKITYSTQLQLFSNYLEEPQNIDVIWNFTFSIALAKHVSSTIRIDMVYDDNQKTFRQEPNAEGVMTNVQHGAKLQVKEFFQIGFAYKFGK